MLSPLVTRSLDYNVTSRRPKGNNLGEYSLVEVWEKNVIGGGPY